MDIASTTIASGAANPGTITFSRAPKLGELIILFSIANNSITSTVPSGFTQKQAVSSGTVQTRLMYKVATATETASYNVTFSGTSDERNLIGYIVANYNVANPFGTDQQKIQVTALSPPQNIFTGSVSFSDRQLTIGICKNVGAARTSPTLTDNFNIDVLLPSSTYKVLSAHRNFSIAASVNPSWNWLSGTAAFVTNFCVINPKDTN